MKNSIVSLFLLIPFFSQAQYYYKDIVANKEMNQLIQLYLANNIHYVTGTGRTSAGIEPQDYRETHEQNVEERKLTIITTIAGSASHLVYHFDSSGKVISLLDSTNEQKNTSVYRYEGSGNLIFLTNTYTESADSITQLEKHIWQYTNNHPSLMYRIIDITDTLTVRFKLDDNNNVIEEEHFKNNRNIDLIYYYYDVRNRLTDIVRYNPKAGRLLPDVMLEYDEQDRVIQKIITTTFPAPGYNTWRYVFNEKGLKTTEAMFNKNKVLQGRVDFTYQ